MAYNLLALSAILVFFFISAHSQSCTSTSGTRGTCIDVNQEQCSGQVLRGRCPGASNIRCCIGGGGGSGRGGNDIGNSGGNSRGGNDFGNGGGNGGGNDVGNGGGNSRGGNSGGGGAVGNLNSFPTTFTTSGYTYNGNKAQTLHFLKQRFTANPTTYASHSDGPTWSADLWTSGAAAGRDNRNIASMNQLAEYCAANTRALGLKYVIWKQRINSGDSRGWRHMADRGGITPNHFDHVHITFTGSSCSGKSCGGRATAPTTQQDYATSTSSPATTATIPAWAVAMIVLSVISLVTVVVVTVLILRKLAAMSREEKV